jgi:hypothetical protein
LHPDIVQHHEGREPSPVNPDDALSKNLTYSSASLLKLLVVMKTPRSACWP